MNDKRYAILGDIHGNWEALSCVLEDAAGQGVTHYASVGDIVGYNASPAECLERVRQVGCVTVRGNHDHYCSHDESVWDFHPLAAKVVHWTRDQLSDEQAAYLRGLPLVQRVDGFTLVHSTLDMPEKWAYVFDALDSRANFNYQTTTVCFYGHTHVPVVFEKTSAIRRDALIHLRVVLGKKYLINVGSVGQPRDGDPRGAYVIYDMGSREIRLRRVDYDIGAAQRRIRREALPEGLAERLALGK